MLFNIYTVIYFIIRLAPFIVVSYFTLQLLFVQDVNNILYLVGLLLACLVSIQLGNATRLKNLSSKPIAKYCKILDLSEDGAISILPLGQTVLSYSLFYIIYIVCKYKLVERNGGTIAVFVILLAGDFLWNMINECTNVGALLMALIIGGTVGMAWAIIIDSFKKITKIDLTEFNNISGEKKPNCKLTKLHSENATYKCT